MLPMVIGHPTGNTYVGLTLGISQYDFINIRPFSYNIFGNSPIFIAF